MSEIRPIYAPREQPDVGRPMLRIFISYASEDLEIAKAVAEAMQGALDDDFAEVNLDKWFMQPGVDFEPQIRRKLEQTDILIVIFTGVSKESHGFTGVEVGYFMRVMEDRPGRMVPLFLSAPPSTLNSVQGIGIGFESRVLSLAPEAFDSLHDVGPSDPMCLFVADLQKRVDELRVAQKFGAARLRPDQDAVLRVRMMRQKIFRILRTKEEISFRPQKQVVFTTTDTAFVKSRPDLPLDALLRPAPAGSPMSIFGLPDVDMTWQGFLTSIAESEYCDSWRQAITSVVTSSFPDKINVDNSQIVVSADKTRSYRIILTACAKYYDDRREFTLCFVEALRRKDFGNGDTSLLLKGLDMVCRFRFLILEKDSEFSANSILLSRPDDLPDLAHGLIRELDLLGRDAKDVGLHKASVWSRFVDWEHLLKMGQDYQPLEQSLREVVGRILSAQDKPDVLLSLRKELADVVRCLEEKIRPANTLLVRSMATKLQEIVAL